MRVPKGNLENQTENESREQHLAVIKLYNLHLPGWVETEQRNRMEELNRNRATKTEEAGLHEGQQNQRKFKPNRNYSRQIWKLNLSSMNTNSIIAFLEIVNGIWKHQKQKLILEERNSNTIPTRPLLLLGFGPNVKKNLSNVTLLLYFYCRGSTFLP